MSRLPLISRTMRNHSGISVMTGLTLRAMGLYFFLEEDRYGGV
jgi:hypothetical protein